MPKTTLDHSLPTPNQLLPHRPSLRHSCQKPKCPCLLLLPLSPNYPQTQPFPSFEITTWSSRHHCLIQGHLHLGPQHPCSSPCPQQSILPAVISLACEPESGPAPPLPTALQGSHLPLGRSPNPPYNPQSPAQPAQSPPCLPLFPLSQSLTLLQPQGSSFLFLQHTRHRPASGPLHRLFPLNYV